MEQLRGTNGRAWGSPPSQVGCQVAQGDKKETLGQDAHGDPEAQRKMEDKN